MVEKNTRLVAKRGLQPTGLSELLQLVPARSLWLLASSLGWLSPVVPWSARGRPGGRCLSPGPGPVPYSLWEVRISAHQVGSSPCSPQQWLSSQHCPAPAT